MQSIPDTIQETTLPEKINRIDIAKALSFRLTQNMTYEQIGKQFNVSKQAVHEALHKYIDVIELSNNTVELAKVKGNILDSVEIALLLDVLNPQKREAASLNNTAYALNTISNISRLEKGLSSISGKDVTLSIDFATTQKKKDLNKSIG